MAIMSSTAQVVDYLGDLARHYFCFWKENAEKVCEDEEDIQGKIVVVTGCNTGIGKMIALQLAKRGAKVIMAVRDLKKGEAAMIEIKESVGKDVDLEILQLDLGDLESIRGFVRTFESKYDKLNILVNNAGFMDTNGVVLKTKDGFEQHIGVNHLGPFLLTRLLIPFLKKGDSSRVVCVSSSNLAVVPLNLDDIKDQEKIKTGDYGKEQYSISKLFNAVCMGKLSTKLGKDCELKMIQLCPGYVKSDVLRYETGWVKKIRNSVSLGFVGLSTHQGSETAVFCCVSKSVTESSDSGRGEIYRFKKIWDKGNNILMNHIKSDTAETLYKISEEMVGLDKLLLQK